MDGMGRLARVADAVETRVARGGGLPAAEADDVKLAVAWIEDGAHCRRRELERQPYRRALHEVADRLLHDVVERARAVAGVEQFALERAELVARHPDLRAAGVVPLEWEPEQRLLRVRVGAQVRIGQQERRAAAGLDPVERAHGHPGAFVVTTREFAAGADADAVGRAETAGNDLQFATVLADPHQRAGVLGDGAVDWPGNHLLRKRAEAAPAVTHRASLREINIPLPIRLEVEHEFVKAGG